MPTRLRDPASRGGLIHRLAALRTEGLDFWRHLDGDAFWTAPGWSPADNLRHLILSARPVSLDRYRLPHPLLGRIALREMLLFTLLHFDHHRDKVAARPGSPWADPSAPGDGPPCPV